MNEAIVSEAVTNDDKVLDLPWRVWAPKVIWIVLRLGLAATLAQKGSYFFYQGF